MIKSHLRSAAFFSVSRSQPGIFARWARLAAACAACALFACAQPALAAVYAVHNESELRNAFTLAGAGDVVLFTPNTGISLGAMLSNATGGFSIDGQGGSLTGNGTSRLIIINSGGFAGISNLTLQGGKAAVGSGGAMYVAGDVNGNIVSSTFSGNGAVTYGGAVYVSGDVNGNIVSSTFSGNSAVISGGAVHVFGDVNGNIVSSTFSGNSAAAYAGAMYANDLKGNIISSTFSNNSAQQDGGAIRVSGSARNIAGGPAVINDSLFLNNRATRNGGAIIFNMSDTVDLALSSSPGGLTLFSGNSDRSGPNSFHFSNSGPNTATLTATGQGSVALLDPIWIELNGARSFTFNRNNSLGSGGAFIWGGRNTVRWAVPATLNFTAGRTDLRADFSFEGLNNNGANNHLILNFGADHRLGLELAGRNPNQAFFGAGIFSGTRTLNVAPNSQIVAPRSFLPASGSYLLITNLASAAGAANFAVQAGPAFQAGVRVAGANDVWLDAVYDPYVNATPDTRYAQYALEQWLWGSYQGLSLNEADFSRIQANPGEMLPDALATSATVALGVANAVQSTALANAFALNSRTDSNNARLVYTAALTPPDMRGGSHQGSWRGFLDQNRRIGTSRLERLDDPLRRVADAQSRQSVLAGWAPVDASLRDNFFAANAGAGGTGAGGAGLAASGIRLWGAGLGNFSNQSSHSGYHGYDSSTVGALLGVTSDLTKNLSIGGYAGYSYTETDFKGTDAEIDAEGVHVGLFARYAADCGFTATLDAAYSDFDNDAVRNPYGLGGSNASFKQEVYSLGLELAYNIKAWAGGTITPFAAGRQTWLEQGGFAESSGFAPVRMKGLEAESTITSLGVRLAHDFVLEDGCAILTPHFTAAWKHEFGDRQMGSTASFTNINFTGNAPLEFGVKGLEQPRDSAVLGLGLDAAFKTDGGHVWGLKAAYGLDLRGMGGDGASGQDHTFYLGAEWRF